MLNLRSHRLQDYFQRIVINALVSILLGLSFGNHHSDDGKDHAVAVMKITGDYDALIRAWYLGIHYSRGVTTSQYIFRVVVKKSTEIERFTPNNLFHMINSKPSTTMVYLLDLLFTYTPSMGETFPP